MAKIINVEKSQYLNQNIEIYTSNKVGQYSKFLDKTPLFVTYLHINEAQTRSDVGLGGVNSGVGSESPVRYNQINNLPMYNFPELKPSTDYGDSGYDIELDLSDLIILPNTVKPATGDFVIVVLPDTIEFAFRVNTFEYNTIQSNDFYTVSLDLKYTGHDLIDRFKYQIVQIYETIFENIGTDDKCFILQEDVLKIQNIGKLFLELRDLYYFNFFDKETGTFVCKNNSESRDDSWLYDKYTEKFIMDAEIYYTENDEKSIMLPCADIEPPSMEREFMQTLHFAVLNNNCSYLARYPYYYQVDIQRRFSPFKIYNINCKSVNLLLTKNKLEKGHSDAIDSGMIFEYFSHLLIKLLKKEITLEELENQNNEIPSEPEVEVESEGETEIEIPEDEENIEKGKTEPDPIPINPELTYLEMVIYQYLNNQMIEIDRDKLISYALQVDNYTYQIIPIILYIIMKYYDSYFKKEEI